MRIFMRGASHGQYAVLITGKKERHRLSRVDGPLPEQSPGSTGTASSSEIKEREDPQEIAWGGPRGARLDRAVHHSPVFCSSFPTVGHLGEISPALQHFRKTVSGHAEARRAEWSRRSRGACPEGPYGGSSSRVLGLLAVRRSGLLARLFRVQQLV